MKPSKLRITSVGPVFCFAETIGDKKPEAVYVPQNNRRLVNNAGTSRTSFSVEKCPIPYFLSVNDIIIAEIGDGNAKRKQALSWTPETVWDGVRGSAGKTAGKVFDFISKTNLATLDPEKDGAVIIRVKNQDGKQLDRGYGNLSKMLDRNHEDIVAFSQAGNVVEALIGKKRWLQSWVQIRNPFVLALIPKIAA